MSVASAIRILGMGACLGAWASGAAWADPGDHIRAGQAVITPSAALGGEFQTNPFRSNRTSAPRNAGNLRIDLGLGIQVRAPKVRFDTGAGWVGRIYPSRTFRPLNNLDNVTFFANLDVAPEGVVGFRLRERLQVPSFANDQEFQINALVTQIRNDLEADLPIRIGPEFELEPGAAWAIHDFRVPSSTVDTARGQFGLNTRNTVGPTLDLNWLFFPNTSFVVETSYMFNRWRDNVVETADTFDGPDFGDVLAKPDSQVLKARTGVRGRITDQLVIAVLVGYGFGIYDADSVDGDAPANASAELGASRDCADADAACFARNVSPTDAILATARLDADFGYDARKFGQHLVFAYTKDFQDSFFTNYVHQHGFQLGLDSNWGRWIGTGLSGLVRLENYEGEYVRNDVFTRIDGDFDILPTRYLTIRLGVTWLGRSSTDTSAVYENLVARGMLMFEY